MRRKGVAPVDLGGRRERPAGQGFPEQKCLKYGFFCNFCRFSDNILEFPFIYRAFLRFSLAQNVNRLAE